MHNDTDGYFVQAALNQAEGVYYVTGHVTEEVDATVFHPVTMGGKPGHVMVKGLEDDEYIIAEVETANGYTLLKDDIHVVITASVDASRPCGIYSEGVLGVLQNDPRYAFDGGLDLSLANIPQKQLAHNLLTGSATVDGNDVNMLTDNGSENAEAPLTIVNTQGFDLPQTGDHGTWMYSTIGVTMMAGALAVMIFTIRKQKKQAEKE